MSIEEIPADELFEMTDLWHRAFNAAGCNPMCHCCGESIPVNSTFRLSTIADDFDGWKNENGKPVPTNYVNENRDVMLCEKCTPEKYKKRRLGNLVKNIERTGGCFRINGKIIH